MDLDARVAFFDTNLMARFRPVPATSSPADRGRSGGTPSRLCCPLPSALRNPWFSDRLRPPMLDRAKRFVLILALAVLPAQGIAASLTKLACHAGAGEQPAPIAHTHDGHQHGPQHDSHSDDSKGTEPEHLTCHHLTSALPVVTLAATVADFPVWAPSSHALPDLFIPDRPQRPPLA